MLRVDGAVPEEGCVLQGHSNRVAAGMAHGCSGPGDSLTAPEVPPGHPWMLVQAELE